jgi:hypothetical protein
MRGRRHRIDVRLMRRIEPRATSDKTLAEDLCASCAPPCSRMRVLRPGKREELVARGVHPRGRIESSRRRSLTRPLAHRSRLQYAHTAMARRAAPLYTRARKSDESSSISQDWQTQAPRLEIDCRRWNGRASALRDGSLRVGFIMTGKLSLQVGTVLPLSQVAAAMGGCLKLRGHNDTSNREDAP